MSRCTQSAASRKGQNPPSSRQPSGPPLMLPGDPPVNLSILLDPVLAVWFADLLKSASARFRIRPRNLNTRIYQPVSNEQTSPSNLSRGSCSAGLPIVAAVQLLHLVGVGARRNTRRLANVRQRPLENPAQKPQDTHAQAISSRNTQHLNLPAPIPHSTARVGCGARHRVGPGERVSDTASHERARPALESGRDGARKQRNGPPLACRPGACRSEFQRSPS